MPVSTDGQVQLGCHHHARNVCVVTLTSITVMIRRKDLDWDSWDEQKGSNEDKEGSKCQLSTKKSKCNSTLVWRRECTYQYSCLIQYWLNIPSWFHVSQAILKERMKDCLQTQCRKLNCEGSIWCLPLLVSSLPHINHVFPNFLMSVASKYRCCGFNKSSKSSSRNREIMGVEGSLRISSTANWAYQRHVVTIRMVVCTSPKQAVTNRKQLLLSCLKLDLVGFVVNSRIHCIPPHQHQQLKIQTLYSRSAAHICVYVRFSAICPPSTSKRLTTKAMSKPAQKGKGYIYIHIIILYYIIS